jgi:ligand-binding sensor domain-containing protein/signal transduction histidine kinase
MRRRRARWILPLLTLLWVAQPSASLRVHVYNTENGLPHNRVNALYTDSKGFLWICTDDGVSRFDGHRFVTYTTADGLPHIHVNGVLETRAGEFWLATDGGLSRFDPRPGRTRFTNYAPPGPVEARYINGIAEEPDGSLTLGTNSGLLRFRISAAAMFERIELPGAAGAPAVTKVHRLAHDARGDLWLATEQGLYQRRDEIGWTRYGTASGLPDVFVTSFAKDEDGRLWIGFKGGFGRIAIDPAPDTPVLDLVRTDDQGRLGREVRALWFARDGRRWVGTDNGLREWLADAKGGAQFAEHPMPDGVPDGAVLSLSEDIAGNLWIGTRRNGVLRAAGSEFLMFGASDGLHLGRDQTLILTRSGEAALFDIGEARNQVYIQAAGRFVVTRPALPESVATIQHWLQTAKQDQTGAWWFSTVSGVFRFPTLGGRFDLHILAGAHADRFFEDAAGDLWISNWRDGEPMARLTRWERSSGRIVDETDRLPERARVAGIAAFAQDHAGALWIGVQRPGGVYRLRHGRFDAASISIGGHINSLFVDSRGRLWIASTEGGLGLVADPGAAEPSLRRFARAQGLSGEEVWCVTEDRLGRIYAGTAHGVDRLMPDSGQIVHYSSADGIVRGDIRSALRDGSGDLWFASANGVSRFTPREDRAIPPAVARIAALRVGGVPFQLSDFGETTVGPLQFRSHQNSLQVDFAVTDFLVRAPLRYQFQLDREGAATRLEAWQDSGTNSTVNLVSLAPGRYALRLRALTPGRLAGPPAVLTFAIQRPLWLTWWFQIAAGVTLAIAAYAVHRHWLGSRLAIERVRSHIAMDLHDDIGASLSRMSVISEALKARLRTGDDEVQRMLNDIAVSSRGLVKDMGDIVWSLDPRHDEVGELASRLRAFGSDLLESRGIEWTVEDLGDELRQAVPPDVRRQLYLVFKEAIHNIGKHAGASKASLVLRVRDGRLRGELIDDGRGMTNGLNGGTGVGSMRARVAQLDGSIDIAVTPAGGTRVRVDVPLVKRARRTPSTLEPA